MEFAHIALLSHGQFIATVTASKCINTMVHFIKHVMTERPFFFSSPDPLGSQGELSCRRSCCPHFSNVFSSETARPIKAKLHVEHP